MDLGCREQLDKQMAGRHITAWSAELNNGKIERGRTNENKNSAFVNTIMAYRQNKFDSGIRLTPRFSR